MVYQCGYIRTTVVNAFDDDEHVASDKVRASRVFYWADWRRDGWSLKLCSSAHNAEVDIVSSSSMFSSMESVGFAYVFLVSVDVTYPDSRTRVSDENIMQRAPRSTYQ